MSNDDSNATGTRPFITDDQIAARLKQAANGLAHLEAAIPALRRELETIAGMIETWQ